MTFVLRPYQRAAVDSVFSYWSRGGPGSPLIEMPTGSGKSLCIGELVRMLTQDHDARVVVVTHRKELIAQDAKAIRQVWPDAPVGIYSAGAGQKRIDRITVAGIQSAVRKADAFNADVVVIDEAHLLSTDESSQYGQFLSSLRSRNHDLRLVGLTATPYRIGQGLLTDGNDALFDTICYRANIKELISAGYLSPLVSPGHKLTQVDTDHARTQAGDWVLADLELAADLQSVNDAVAKDVADAIYSGRTSALVFGVSVKHAEHMCEAIRLQGINAQVVTGETQNRSAILDAFKARQLQCIVSMDVLTTGFDAPCTDVIALVRPTKSPGLYVQMCGRGMRISDGKSEGCLLLDYGGNIARHGPLTEIRPPKRTRRIDGAAPTKECPQCSAMVPAGARTCVHCDYEFPPPEKKANDRASELDPIGDGKPDPPRAYDVMAAMCRRHTGKASGREMMRVDFMGHDWRPVVSEYVCIEHEGYARLKAERWWAAFFTCPCPQTIDEALTLYDGGHMRAVKSVTVVRDGKYRKVKSVEFWPNMTYDPAAPEGEDKKLIDVSEKEPTEDVAITLPADMDDIPF